MVGTAGDSQEGAQRWLCHTGRDTQHPARLGTHPALTSPTPNPKKPHHAPPISQLGPAGGRGGSAQAPPRSRILLLPPDYL